MAKILFERAKLTSLKLSEKSGRYYGRVLEEFSTAPYPVSFPSLPTVPENKIVSLDLDVELNVYEGKTTFNVIESKFKVL